MTLCSANIIMKIKDFWNMTPYCLHHQGDDGGSMHLWTVGLLQRNYTKPCPRRHSTTYSPQWESQISQKYDYFLRNYLKYLAIHLCLQWVNVSASTSNEIFWKISVLQVRADPISDILSTSYVLSSVTVCGLWPSKNDVMLVLSWKEETLT
jgi:hypothetical protein